MSAAAFVLALALAQASDPYVRSRAQDSQYDPPACLYWTATQLVWQQSSLGNPKTTDETEFAAVSRSFQTWADPFASCGNLALVEGPRVADRQVGYVPTGGNRNLVLFRMQECSAVVPSSDACLGEGSCANKYDCWDFGRDTIGITTVSYDVRTGVIYDADIELNGRFNFTTVDSPRCVGTSTSQSCVSTDVQNTVTHEAGHFIGLDHTLASGSVMNPEASTGETSKRRLDSGSASFVCEVYPRGKASVSCVDRVTQTPSGEDSDGGCASAGAGAALAGLLLLFPVLRRRRPEQP